MIQQKTQSGTARSQSEIPLIRLSFRSILAPLLKSFSDMRVTINDNNKELFDNQKNHMNKVKLSVEQIECFYERLQSWFAALPDCLTPRVWLHLLSKNFSR